MARAIWNGAVLAESEDVEVVEGNLYFPRGSLSPEYFVESGTRTRCGWKGEASYYDIKVADKVNSDAAWYYPEPSPAAANITDSIAFWRGVQVEP